MKAKVTDTLDDVLVEHQLSHTKGSASWHHQPFGQNTTKHSLCPATRISSFPSIHYDHCIYIGSTHQCQKPTSP